MLIPLLPFRFGFASNLKYIALGTALIFATVGAVHLLQLPPEVFSEVLATCLGLLVLAVIVAAAFTGRTVWSLRLDPQGVALVTNDGAVVDASAWSEMRWTPGRHFLFAGAFSRNVPVITLTFSSGRAVKVCHLGYGGADTSHQPASGRPAFYVIPDQLNHLGQSLQAYSPMG